jgi:phosphotransferase system IIB component
MDYCIPRLRVHMASFSKAETKLTKTERKLYQILSKTSTETILGECIRIALTKKSNEEFRKVVQQLKEQLRDAPALLCQILGDQAIELLKQL